MCVCVYLNLYLPTGIHVWIQKPQKQTHIHTHTPAQTMVPLGGYMPSCKSVRRWEIRASAGHASGAESAAATHAGRRTDGREDAQMAKWTRGCPTFSSSAQIQTQWQRAAAAAAAAVLLLFVRACTPSHTHTQTIWYCNPIGCGTTSSSWSWWAVGEGQTLGEWFMWGRCCPLNRLSAAHTELNLKALPPLILLKSRPAHNVHTPVLLRWCSLINSKSSNQHWCCCGSHPPCRGLQRKRKRTWLFFIGRYSMKPLLFTGTTVTINRGHSCTCIFQKHLMDQNFSYTSRVTVTGSTPKSGPLSCFSVIVRAFSKCLWHLEMDGAEARTWDRPLICHTEDRSCSFYWIRSWSAPLLLLTPT